MKINELREMTEEELKLQLKDSQEEIFNLRFQQSMNRLENADRIKKVKRDIARIKTLITEFERTS